MQVAFENYFRKLQVKGVLDLPAVMAKAKIKLEDEVESLRQENERQRKELEFYRSLQTGQVSKSVA